MADTTWSGQRRFAALVDEHGNQKLAQILNVSNATISHWKAGRRIPGIDDLLTLSRALHFSLDWLLELTEQNAANDSSVALIPLLADPYPILNRTVPSSRDSGSRLAYLTRSAVNATGHRLVAVRALGWLGMDLAPAVLPRDLLLLSYDDHPVELIPERLYLVHMPDGSLKIRFAYPTANGWAFTAARNAPQTPPVVLTETQLKEVLSVVVGVFSLDLPL